MSRAPRKGTSLALATVATLGLTAMAGAGGAAWGAIPASAPALTPAAMHATNAGHIAADPGAIPASATGTLRIHRLRPGPSGSADVAVAGVTLKVSRVSGVDLRTSAGWHQAAAYQRDMAGVYSALGDSRTSAPTDSNGLTVLSDLPVGLYLIQEVSGGSSISGYVKSDDILVTVPGQASASSRWVYTRDVYPKTSGATITKTVADGKTGVEGQDAPVAGRVLTYTLESSIPAGGLKGFGGKCVRGSATDSGGGLDSAGFTADGLCASGAHYVGVDAGAAYEIVDDLTQGTVPGSQPPRRTSDYLEYTAPEWSGGLDVSVTGAASRNLIRCTTATTGSCDFTLAHEPHRISVAMTDNGLQALQQARASDQSARVRVSVKARVRPGSGSSPAPVDAATRQSPDALDGAVPATVLNLPNKAVVFPNGRSKTTGTPVPSNTVVTKYSTLKLHKVAAHDDSPLAGAVFTLYRTLADAEAGNNALSVSEPTNAAGMTQFAGVQVTDYKNDTFTDDSYWIVETRTPAGYVHTGRPIEVKVLMDGTTVGADHTLGKPIVNERGDVPGAVTPDEPDSQPSPGPASGSSSNPPGSIRPSWVPPLNALPYTGMEVGTAAALAAALVAAGLLLRRASRDREETEAEA